MAIVSVGTDLAKNVFAVHCVDESGKPALVRPSVSSAKLLEFIASVPPCLIGMEACGIRRWALDVQPVTVQQSAMSGRMDSGKQSLNANVTGGQ